MAREPLTPIEKVEQASTDAAVARDVLELAIHQASEAGEPLRRIADAAGVSHEQVRRILSR